MWNNNFSMFKMFDWSFLSMLHAIVQCEMKINSRAAAKCNKISSVVLGSMQPFYNTAASYACLNLAVINLSCMILVKVV